MSDLPEARTTKQKPDEIGWLIETSFSPVLWLQVDPIEKTYRWTDNANEAIRFARKIDAEAMIGLWSLIVGRASEHMWQDVPPPLKCPECGADRTLEPCGRSFMPGKCPMIGEAQ